MLINILACTDLNFGGIFANDLRQARIYTVLYNL